MLRGWNFYCLAVQYLGVLHKQLHLNNKKLGTAMCTFILVLSWIKKKKKNHTCKQPFFRQCKS